MRAKIIAALLASGLASTAFAAPLQVPINHSVRLGLSGAAASVVVGNPSIADVTVVDSRTLFLSGKSFGTTDVVVVDALGRTIYNADVVVSPPSRGHVAVYRGGEKSADRTDMACSPRCQVDAKAGEMQSSGSAATAAALPASTASTAPITN